ncbi:DUF2812 domain-containing protein [Solibacillus merdavium]|uniref:DUF2812 domain-containing protein n=1 Tax=Solibacillus merdavium TaxID=2762218 RepID=A0ABR8XM46_9BACL|nr:DUF2812 domain-containing protein [Solibacillus merdavium]MBD8033001.1 DUF2812 domain-containing protein [Solibacillus merdavium]
MRKFKIFMDDAKEEQWINDMASQGWHFKSFNFPLYSFDKGEPAEYEYRTEMLEGFGYGKAANEYLDFVQSTGIEVVQKRFNWVYFRQHKSKGNFELYSDQSSKLSYINRIFTIYSTLAVLNLIAAIINGSVLLLDESLRFNSFIAGLNTGVFIALLYPLAKTVYRKQNLKREIAMYEK